MNDPRQRQPDISRSGSHSVKKLSWGGTAGPRRSPSPREGLKKPTRRLISALSLASNASEQRFCFCEAAKHD